MDGGQDSSQDRGTGFLTKEYKAHLRGETEKKTSNALSTERNRIRNHVRNAIVDFALIFQHLDQDEREQILDQFVNRSDKFQLKQRGEELPPGPPELQWDIIDPNVFRPYFFTGGLKSMQAFIFLLFHDLLIDQSDRHLDEFEAFVAHFIEESLQDAIGKKDKIVDATVDISLDEIDIDSEILGEAFDEGYDKINDKEVEWLFQLREIGFRDNLDYALATRHSNAAYNLVRNYPELFAFEGDGE